jgi:hypothetical protein
MQVENFKLEFSFRRNEIVARCSKFQIANYPQIFVAFGEPLKETTFTFYLLPDKVFWFNLPDIQKQSEAKKIADLLAARYSIKAQKNGKGSKSI